MPFRFLTAGESHGPALTALIEGMPAGVPLLAEQINFHLARRQSGYGRGGRMKIETDRAQISAGVRHGFTMGSPIALTVVNSDFESWGDVMKAHPVPEYEKTVLKLAPSKCRDLGTSITPDSSNTGPRAAICVTFWNAPRRAKPRCASRQEAWRGACWKNAAFSSEVM